MLRLKLLLILLSGVLIIAACGDVGTDPDGPDDPNGDEPVEPTASVNNPEGDATLEGEITFSIDGEAENGFSEARIYVGEEEVEVVDNPNMPYEQTITTFNYNNGDYDLRVELDVAEEDTSIETSVSATFENYMVTLETDDYIESLSNDYDASYLFISDPEGNVLQAIELTAKTDGELQFLPPEEIEGQAPDNYSLTIGKQITINGEEKFYINTDVGLESWSTIYQSGSVSSGEETSSKELTVELSNFENPSMATFATDYDWSYWSGITGDPWGHSFTYEDSMDNLLIRYESETEEPKYLWEENMSEVADGGRLEYNVGEDFTPMTSTTVSLPENVDFNYYWYQMSVASDSWDDGLFYLPSLTDDYGEINNNNEFTSYIPDEDHLYDTYMTGTLSSNENISAYNYTYDEFPDSFVTLDAEGQINNQSMDNLELEMSGNLDVAVIYVENYSEGSHHHEWSLNIPDTTEAVVFPNIADSLGQSVDTFSRSDFKFTDFYLHNLENLDGYGDLLESIYGTTDSSYGDQYSLRILLDSNQQNKMAAPAQSAEKGNILSSQENILNKEFNKRNMHDFE